MTEYAPQLHAAIGAARRVLAEAEQVDGYDIDGVRGSHWELCSTLRQLLDALAQDRPARMAVQADEGCRNLARAARREIQAAQAAVSRLESFEKALSQSLWPDEAEGGERP